MEENSGGTHAQELREQDWVADLGRLQGQDEQQPQHGRNAEALLAQLASRQEAGEEHRIRQEMEALEMGYGL